MADGQVVYEAKYNNKQVILGVNQDADAIIAAQKRVNDATGRTADETGRKFRQLGFAAQRAGVRGVAAFGEFFAAIGPIGIAVGVVTVGLVAATKAAIAFGRAGVEQFKQLLIASQQQAAVLDATRSQFTAFFEGDMVAAEQVITRMFSLSRKLGEDVTEIGRAFLPYADNIDQLEQLVEIATGLARSQPEQGITGARISLLDFLSGQTRSIVQRFEIPLAKANELKQILEDQGAQAGLDALQAELERTGRSVEALSDTYEVLRGKVTQFFREMQTIAGAPILDELKEGFREIFDFLEENEDDIRSLFFGIGQTSSEFLGQGFEFVKQIAQSVVNAIPDIIAMFQALEDSAMILGVFRDTFTDADLVEDGPASVAQAITAVNVMMVGLLNTTLSWVSAAAAGYDTMFRLGKIAAAASQGDFVGVGALVLEPTLSSYQSEWEKAEARRIEIISGLLQGIRETRMEQHEYNQSLADGADVSTAAADAFMNAAAAARFFAERSEEARKAQESINEALAGFNLDYSRAWEDMETDRLRKVEDVEQDISAAREKAARDNVRKLRDIYDGFLEDQFDDRLRWQRKEEDILRDFARKELDFAEQIADDRAKIERDLQAELDRINRRADFQQRQAIRDNDAVAFVRINEQRDFDLNEARLRATDEADEVVRKAQERRDELNRLLQQELEDARIANSRRVEDTLRGYQRELEAANTRYQDELQELRITEAAKREELALSFERQQEDFDLRWQRKIEDLNSKYAAELRLLSEFQNQEYRIVLQHRQRMAALNASMGTIGGGGLLGGGTVPDDDGQYNAGKSLEELRKRATDLATAVNRTDLLSYIQGASRSKLLSLIESLERGYLSGKGSGSSRTDGGARGFRGPEDGGMRYSPPAAPPAGSGRTNVAQVSQTFVDPTVVSPEQAAFIRQMMLEVMQEAMR